MKKAVFLLALLMAQFAQATDYVLPIIECDGSANVRAKPTTKSTILTELNYQSSAHKVLGKQGNWYHIDLPNQKSGYVHKSQVMIMHYYVVDSKDGSANVRDGHFPYSESIGKTNVLKVLTNGTRVQIIPELNKGDWFFYSQQGLANKDEESEGYIHKSQLKKVD